MTTAENLISTAQLAEPRHDPRGTPGLGVRGLGPWDPEPPPPPCGAGETWFFGLGPKIDPVPVDLLETPLASGSTPWIQPLDPMGPVPTLPLHPWAVLDPIPPLDILGLLNQPRGIRPASGSSPSVLPLDPPHSNETKHRRHISPAILVHRPKARRSAQHESTTTGNQIRSPRLPLPGETSA